MYTFFRSSVQEYVTYAIQSFDIIHGMVMFWYFNNQLLFKFSQLYINTTLYVIDRLSVVDIQQTGAKRVITSTNLTLLSLLMINIYLFLHLIDNCLNYVLGVLALVVHRSWIESLQLSIYPIF